MQRTCLVFAAIGRRRIFVFQEALPFGNIWRPETGKCPQSEPYRRFSRGGGSISIRIMLLAAAGTARLALVRCAPPREEGRTGSRPWKRDMAKRSGILGVILLSSGMLMLGPTLQLLAATSSILDVLPNDVIGAASDTVEVGTVKPLAGPKRAGGKPLPSGNPLWAIPLSALTATQERPIFSASRRPPPRAVIAPAVDQVSAPAPQVATEPERPALALIGAVVGESDAIAIFLDRTNQKIVRLRQGETHAGWVLSSVLGREVILKRADRSEVLGLQRTDGPAAASGVPSPTAPATGDFDTSYVPFTPRATPKNGESDGL
jgi:general secretion pathway protein N